MILKKVLFVSFFILLTIYIRAQKPLFHQFSTNQGLSSTETYHAFQDSKGYIWISTTNGVSRFDGYTFQNFDEQDGLSDNVIFETTEDYKGRIWFVGFNCKLSYYENGQIKPYRFNHLIEKLVDNTILSVKSSFYIDRKDNIYLSLSYLGVLIISPNGILTRENNYSQMLANIIEKDNKILVSQYSGKANEFNINIKNIHTSIKDQIMAKSRRLAIFAVQSSDQKSLFVVCDHLMFQVFSDGHYSVREMGGRIIWLSRDRENNIWVGSFNGGVVAIDEKNFMGPFIHSYLSDQSVSSVLQDKEGGLWFTTLDDGVFYLPSHTTLSYSFPRDLPDYDILNVEAGEKEIFTGTGNGFLSVIKDNKISNYPIDTNLHSEITALTYDKVNKQLYVSTTDNAYIFKDGKISHLLNHADKRNKKYEQLMVTFKSIIKESDSTYWLGNFNSLSLVNVKEHIVLYNSIHDGSANRLRINSLYRYPDGSLLIGTADGLWTYKNKKINPVTNFKIGQDVRIRKITGDVLGNHIWVATKGSGLYLRSNDSVYRFTRKDGLLNNTVSDLWLNKNDLWLATSQGISCISIKNYKPLRYTLHNYTISNGLASNQVYQIKTFGEKILIATNRGLLILNKNSFTSNSIQIPLYITKVRLMMRDTVLDKNSSLPHNLNSISFSFVGINYQSISKIKYQYRLKGLDEEWHTTQETEISFPFLPPNRYEFELRTINDDNKVTSLTVVQKFIIRQPFWKTGWFILLVILSLLAGGYFIYLNRIKTIEQNNLTQHEINQYRQQALSKQMNPHFLFNSLNSIQYYIVKNDRISSSRYLSKFATLMRVILNNSQNQAISLDDEMSALQLYLELESMRFKDQFEFTIEVDPQINRISTLIPPFIIQPFIENAIWHGLMNRAENGLLKIKIIKEEFALQCIVEDNGVGRKRAAEIVKSNPFHKTSKGISITETRLRLINKKGIIQDPVTYTDLYDQNGIPEGTRVEIHIPIMN
jgi:ligand-binding sensor domain-containing protein